MKSTLRLILGDQLSHRISALEGIDPKNDVVLMCEVMEEATYVPHHPKKIAFLFSAMRHFAEELCKRGITVRYVTLDNLANTHSFDGEVKRAIDALQPAKLIMTEPGEYRVLSVMKNWQKVLKLAVEIRPDNRFLCTPAEFVAWAKGKRQLHMEFFLSRNA